jgi:hypothetical protein
MEIPNFRIWFGISLCVLQKMLGKSEFPYPFSQIPTGKRKTQEKFVFQRYAMEWKRIKRKDVRMPCHVIGDDVVDLLHWTL